MSELAQFVGRFHPLLVHFPIALLLVAALLRLVEGRFPWAQGSAESYQWSRLLLGLGAIGSLAAALTGLLLGNFGDYSGDTVAFHQLAGIGVALSATLAFAASWMLGRRRRRLEHVLLTIAVVLLIPAGHLGATLTHGEGYLTEHAPAFVKRFIGGGSEAASLTGRAPERIVVYSDLVAPVLRSNCVACHGPASAQGGLRLHDRDAILKGGDHGQVISAGKPASSQLVRRIFLPSSHADVMPPRGRRPLTPSDAALVRWWVETGARFDLTLADAEISPEVLASIEARTGPLVRGGPTLPDDVKTEASAADIAAVKAEGFSVVRIADGRPFLHVHCTNATSRITDTSLTVLQKIAPQLIWLDLSGTRVSDAGLKVVGDLTNLTQLHLQHTMVRDFGLAFLSTLQRLEYLNLYGTGIGDGGLVHLASLKHLRTLYVWETRVTPAGVSQLKAALPKLTVETGVSSDQSGSAP